MPSRTNFEVAPLPHEWMIVSIIGFFVSLLLIYPSMSQKWGAAFMVFFMILFVASIVSMTNASTADDHLAELSVHEKNRRKPKSIVR